MKCKHGFPEGYPCVRCLSLKYRNRKTVKITIEEAERPDTPEGENAATFDLYRSVLDEITVILEMPGSPSYSDIPKVLRERLK